MWYWFCRSFWVWSWLEWTEVTVVERDTNNQQMRAKTSETVDLSGIRAHYVSVWVCSSCFELTHRVALAIVVAWVWIESTQLRPAKTHLILGLVKEPTYIRPGLKKRDRKKRKVSVFTVCECVLISFSFPFQNHLLTFFEKKKKKKINQAGVGLVTAFICFHKWTLHGHQGEGVIPKSTLQPQ